jgi:glycosyltransferase involved in cell wall biosynthesis
MKIAQIAPIIERVPPKKYGGTERVVHALTEELVRQDHDVTLFASGDSETAAKLVSVHPRSLREVKMKDLYGANALTMLNIGMVYDRQDEFDVIHDHNGYLSLPAANMSRTPVVMTLHGAFTAENIKVFSFFKRVNLVTISKAQGYRAPGIAFARNIYHGLQMEKYPFSDEHDDYLLFVGRISMEKGVHHAIQVALSLDAPLVIAAKLESIDMRYFEEYVGPYLSDRIRWIGEVDEDERNRLMSRAKCFLHAVTWPEPFGLTLIESMACGCPVVAFNMGSIPEVISHGETGFVVNNELEMIDAVAKIDEISRTQCRYYALKHFSAERMTTDYVKLYGDILERRKKKNR